MVSSQRLPGVHPHWLFYFPVDRLDEAMAQKGGRDKLAKLKGLRIGVQQATTGAMFVDEKLQPTTPAKVFPDTTSMFTALLANQIDVAMTDTAIVLGQASVSGGRFVVVGQYSTGETYGAIYPKGSPNNTKLDEVIQSLIDDGTLKKLSATYLAAAWGADPTAIPYFQP